MVKQFCLVSFSTVWLLAATPMLIPHKSIAQSSSQAQKKADKKKEEQKQKARKSEIKAKKKHQKNSNARNPKAYEKTSETS